MKKYMMVGAVVGFAAVCALQADDSMRTTRTAPAPVKIKNVEVGPVDRELEVRVGPQVTFVTGDVRIGKTGTQFDVWDDLKLDDVSPGVKFDVDWQPINNLHFGIDASWSKFDQSGTTGKDISDGENILRAGATTKADLDIYSFKGIVGYDVLKTKTYRLRPYVGGIVGLVDGTASWNGTVANSAGVNIDPSRTKSTKLDNVWSGSYIIGIDQRVYVSRDWYLGGDIGGTALNNWWGLSGDAYTGYDFTKNWGVRLGYAFNYVNWENGPKAGKAEPLVGSAYVQAVWGF